MTDQPFRAIEEITNPHIEEKRRIERWQAFYHPLIENTDTIYTSNPSFQVTKTPTTTYEKTPISTQSEKTNFTNTTFTTLNPSLPKLDTKYSHKTQKNSALGFEIAKAMERNEKILQDITETLTRNISYQNQVILKLSKEDEEHLNELLKQLSKKENVDMVKSLLNISVASSAIVIGSLILAPEALAAAAAGGVAYTSIYGLVLIASGVTNLIANEFLPRIDGFEKIASFFTSDEQAKQKLADNIQTASSITSTILSLGSAIASGPIIGSVLKWATGLQIANTAVNFANSSTSFISNVNEYTYKNLQAEQTTIDGKTNLEQFKLDQEFASLQSAADIEVTFNKISFNIFQTLQKMSENNNN